MAKLQGGQGRTCHPAQILAARADWPSALRAPEMAQNLALAVAFQRQKVQESSGTPTGGVGASMRGYSPTASRVGGGCSDQYLPTRWYQQVLLQHARILAQVLE